ncbi:SRPBCC domain-containing protein [Fusibacter bizertensis]
MLKLEKIKIEVTLNEDLNRVWEYFTEPKHIIKWYFASDDWHCPNAVNSLSVGNKFNYRMEAKDGSFGFDFEGEYLKIIPQSELEYILADGRIVNLYFEKHDDYIKLIEIFDPEKLNPIEMQREGWLSILKNFKKYVEGGE